MEVLKDNQLELAVFSPSPSCQELMGSQMELFQSQIDQLQNIVSRQCKLTGVNPLSQEMAAGALSVKIGKRPRDLLNPKAVKYIQSVFSVKDAINKKESREISALFGVTVTQVREFVTSQRTRVRKFVRQSREKALVSNAFSEDSDGVPISSDLMLPNNPVPLNSMAPTSIVEVPSSSCQNETLPGIDEPDKHFVDNIFVSMRKEETFSGQVKLMEWIMQIKTPAVLLWFLTKGGVMVLATWLSQAAIEEQTSVLHVILKVLCHLPLHKALPVHMSAILQSVNKLRFYSKSDVSNRARILLSRWSKLFARAQAMKKPNAIKSSNDAQNEMLLKQSIGEIMDNELWDSKADLSGERLVTSFESSESNRKLENSQPLKLLQASADDSNKKLVRGVSSSQTRERRKVQLVEQPGQRRSMQVAKSVPANQGRPLSADDIQKAKMRAQFMQSKYGKPVTLSTANEGSNKCSPNIGTSPSKSQFRSPRMTEEEQKKSVACKVSSNLQEPADDNNKISMDPPVEEPLWKKCKRFQIQWFTPPEVRINDDWSVSAGEFSKEVEIQRNRIRREKEIFYATPMEIPSDPKEPWDSEMDYDDTLTPEIPIEQLPDDADEQSPDPDDEQMSEIPDADVVETPVVSSMETEPTADVPVAASSQNGDVNMLEPDLELLGVLLKNPELVFALTSGQAGGLSSEDTVRLLDMIKANGINSNLNGLVGGGNVEAKDKVEVSLPSPTPSSNPVTSGWSTEAAKNPFSRHGLVANTVPPIIHTTTTVPPPRIPSPAIHTTTTLPPPPPPRFPSMVQHNHQQMVGPPLSFNGLPERHLPPPPPPAHHFSSPNINTPNVYMHPMQTWSHQQPQSGPEPHAWRTRQGSGSNAYVQVSRNNENGPYEGPVWDRDQFYSEQPEFETWSPEERDRRNRISPEYGFYGGPQGYRNERSRPRGYSGHRDHNNRYYDNSGNGNGRWRDHRGGRRR